MNREATWWRTEVPQASGPLQGPSHVSWDHLGCFSPAGLPKLIPCGPETSSTGGALFKFLTSTTMSNPMVMDGFKLLSFGSWAATG